MPPVSISCYANSMVEARVAEVNPTPFTFMRKEVLGDDKINVIDQPAVVISEARAIAKARDLEKNDDAFTIINLDALYERFELWKRELPQIEPFYAIKCNSDTTIIRTLAALGAGFDCASREEIEAVLRAGVTPDRIVYANPCKTSAFIAHAESIGVNLMTFDSAEELLKIAKHHDRPELLLRIAVSDTTATHPLSGKFGADPVQVAPQLLRDAAEMGLPVVGVCFHVGSRCNDPSAFLEGLQHARRLFDVGLSLGHRMEIVDVGGGFPGTDQHALFEKIAAVLRSGLREYFPEPSVRVIAEPGRFFATTSSAVVVNVIALKTVTADVITKNPLDAATSGRMYYVNDGLFGSFNGIYFDHQEPNGRPLVEKEGPLYPSTIWGPTCDSIDRIEECKMMRELSVGGWIIYENMGAYSSSCSSTFNGFQRPQPIYVVSEHVW